MAINILMPALSPTMTEGNLARWLKAEGDKCRSPAKSSPKSKPTRPRWKSRPWTRASLRKNPHRSRNAGRQRQHADRGVVGGGREQRPCAKRCATPWPRKCAATRTSSDGRGSRRVSGRLQDQPGLLDEFGPRASSTRRSPSMVLPGRRRRGDQRPAPHRRVHDLELRDAGDRPDHQLRGQDALHVRRPAGLPHRVPRPERRGCARRRTALTGFYASWYAHIPGLKVVAPWSALTQKAC
jgi:hypothetical protein